MTVASTPATAVDDPTAPDAGVPSESVAVSTWTIVSRATGLAKLAVTAAVLGPSYLGNAFQGMNLLPTAAYEFLTGSLLVNLLVPHLVKHARAGSDRDVERVAGGFLGRALVVFGMFTAALYLARPFVLSLFTTGVADPSAAAAQREVSAVLLTLMLPQILLYAVAGVSGSVLNARGRFGLVAAAPAFENVSIIATVGLTAVLFGSELGDTRAPMAALMLLGGGATAAVAAHAGALWLACRATGITLVPRWARGDEDVRTIVAGAPATLGQAGLNALRTVAGLVAANAVAGGVVAFQFAMTFFYLPAALGAKAVGVPMLRRLATAFHDNDEPTFSRHLTEGLRLTAFIALPAAVFYLALATPIVQTVAFGDIATVSGMALVAVALTALAPGVIGEASFLIGSYASYARGDARTPFRSMLVRTIITVGGMVAAMIWTQDRTLILCLGLAVTAGNVFAATHLAVSQRRWVSRGDGLGASVARTAIASAAIVLAGLPIAVLLRDPDPTTSERVVNGILVLLGGGLAYLVTHRILGSPELADLRGALPWRRTPASSDVPATEGTIAASPSVVIDGDTVRKTYTGPDARARALREYEILGRLSAHLADVPGLTCPRPLGISSGIEPAITMTRLAGRPLEEDLSAGVLSDDEIETLAGRMADALVAFVEATGEPYHDFHVRNALWDPPRTLAILDFDYPADLGPVGGSGANAFEVSIGNLIGSAMFEAARPKRIRQRAFAPQAMRLCRSLLDRFGPSSRYPASEVTVMAVADAVYRRAAHRGGILRRAWYLTVGAAARRRAARLLPRTDTELPTTPAAAAEAPVAHPSPPSVTGVRTAEIAPIAQTQLADHEVLAAAPVNPAIDAPSRRRLVVAGSVVIAGLSVLLALEPLATAAVVGALAFAALVVVHPPIAAYALLLFTPLLVGLNRSSVLPILRVNEALLLLAGAGVLARGVARWAWNRTPTVFRLGRMELSIAALLVTGSILPLMWLAARGRPITADDTLYALALWKLAATYFVIRAAVRTSAEVRRCLWLSMAAAVVVGVVGIAQALGVLGVPSFLARYYAPDGLTAIVTNNRATSTIGNAIAFGDVMAVHAAIAAAFFLRRDRRPMILIALGALFSIAALASGQLSGALALMIALFVVAIVTGRGRAIALAALPVLLLSVLFLRPVVEQRLSKVDPVTGVPQSWTARRDNLETYFLPELREPAQTALGVRPAARVPAHEGWRDWVYIESGYVWLMWTGGIPLLIAFLVYVRNAYRSTSTSARYRRDAIGIASVAAVAALAILTVLMILDPHLTMRGTADLTFGVLALATARIAWTPAPMPQGGVAP